MITHLAIFMPCRNVAGGVCRKIDASVPRMTIVNAAGEISAPAPAPLRIAPPMTAISASTTPTTDRLSMHHSFHRHRTRPGDQASETNDTHTEERRAGREGDS